MLALRPFRLRSGTAAAYIAPGLWNKAADRLPERCLIDVFYVNPNFDPPVSGVIENVIVIDSIISSRDGTSIPSCYVEFWKASLGRVGMKGSWTKAMSASEGGVPWRAASRIRNRKRALGGHLA